MTASLPLPPLIEVLFKRRRELAGMEIDAELRRQILVSLSAAAVFVVGLIGVGSAFGRELPDTEAIELTSTGAIALVALLAAFVLLMALVGAYLIYKGDDA